MLRVTPSTASEHNSGVAGLIVNPQVLRCFLRPSLTKAPSLHQRYPASSVLRTFPPPHTAQPDSRELPVDRVCHHRWGFPCCCWSTLPACRRHYPGRSDGPPSLVLSHQRRPSRLHGGLAPALIVSRPAQRSLTLRPTCSPSRLSDPLHRRPPTASFPPPPLRLLPGGANPVPGRDFHPQSSSAFPRRTRNGDLTLTTFISWEGSPRRVTQASIILRKTQWAFAALLAARRIG